MSEQLVPYNPNNSISSDLLIEGDLSRLTDSERTIYYMKLCESLGLNPLTKPFEYMRLNGKLILYAKRDCTEQLRKIHGVSITIVSREDLGDIYIVTARAIDKYGRQDESVGVVPLFNNMNATDKANALMKCETKAKRRVTLSICGLGFMDESEAETVPYNAVVVSTETGVIERDVPYKDYPTESSLRRLKAFFDEDLELYLNEEEYTLLRSRYKDTLDGKQPDKTNKKFGYTEKRVNEVLGFWEWELRKRKEQYEAMVKLAEEEQNNMLLFKE